ncbi:MAG: hypothetical protein WCF25_13535 [Acidimicrobiales bacterium]
MARTRAQRRRHSLFIIIALVVTLVVLVFARDISRAGHGAITSQRSEDRSFGALANALITQENDFDQRFARLLRSGSSLTRPVFDARLDQLDQELAYWTTTAELLRHPKLAHDVNDKMADLTETRITDYEEVIATIANALSLPVPSPRAQGTLISDPASSLLDAGVAWNRDRSELRHEPGNVRLDKLTLSSAKYFITSGVDALSASSSLAVVRGIGIAAISVVPAPLPSKASDLVLPPVSSIKLGISVENTGFVEQHVTLEVSMQPSNGPLAAQRQSFHVVLAPLQSYAFAPNEIAVVPSERATLSIRVTGAPASPNLQRSKVFRVEMSPAGHT